MRPQCRIGSLALPIITTPSLVSKTIQLFMGGGYHESTRQWDRDEILLLLKLRMEMGNRWERIGDRLRRSPSSVRNKYNRMKRACEHPGKGNVCHRCGMRKRGHVCGLAPAPARGEEFEASLWWVVDTLALSPLPLDSLETAEEEDEETGLEGLPPLTCHRPEEIVGVFMEV